MFTRDDLPVGTVITIDSGYRYRPEGWIDLKTLNSSAVRPGNVTTSSVTVTEEWWGNFNYRAFNISTTSSQGDISNVYLDVASHFNITLPDGTKFLHPKKEGGNSDGESNNPIVIPEDDSAVLILAIGNSYSSDATHYTHKIAEGLGIKAEFYNLYYGGCTIDQHYSFYKNDKAEYDFFKNMSTYTASKVSLKNALEATQYDYITVQQGSWSSDSYGTYSNLDELLKTVREYQPNATFIIHQTWGYCTERATTGNGTSGGKGYASSAKMFEAVENCYNRAASDNGNLNVIRSGKAVEIAKTYFEYTDDYGKAASVYSDFNSHLSNKGDYLAGCVWVETIFGKDVRNTTYTADFADAYILREIAHQAVNGTFGATVSLDEFTDIGEAPIKKAEATDGFDYDGRARITLYGTDGSKVKVYMQNDDGSLPDLDRIPAGKYYLTVERNGYLTYKSESFDIATDSVKELDFFRLIAGDIKQSYSDFCGDGVIDIDDFTLILRAFDSSAEAKMRVCTDVNSDGITNVTDLAIVKANFGKKCDN